MELTKRKDFYKELKVPRKVKGIKDENLIIKTRGTENMMLVAIFLIPLLEILCFYYLISDGIIPKKIVLIIEVISFFLIMLSVIVYILSEQEIRFEKNKIIYINKRGSKKNVNIEENIIIYVEKNTYYVDFLIPSSVYYLKIENDNEKMKLRILVSYKKAWSKLLNNLELE